MDKHIGTGRVMGAAMLVGALLEVWSNFGLQSRLFEGGGFIANAAGHPRTIGLIIVMGLLAGLLSLWVAALLSASQSRTFPVLSRIYFALAAIALGATLVELATFVAMREVSEVLVSAPRDADSRVGLARAIVHGLRNGLHFSIKTFEGISLVAFYLLLLKAKALPQLLASAGIAAALLQMVAVGGTLFGNDVIYMLLVPIGVVYLATALWFLARGLLPPTVPAIVHEFSE